ncbi:MAG: sulfatase-like hydrolase/transferase, partial [Geminicoccaceae bacterium]
MLWRVFLAVAMVVVVLARSEAAPPPPNFVVILADDLGYGEVGARRVGDVATPNIDAIARAGVTFTDGYVTANLCSPSRAGLLTGRYQQEFGVYGNPGKPPYPSRFGLPAAQVTLAEALKGRGYSTGIVGKWHLGVKPADNPLNHGFDEFFGVMDTDHPYFGEMKGNPILSGTTPVAASGYLTDTLAAEAVKFIRGHAGQKFFLYAPFTAAHSPYQAKPEILARLGHIKNEKRRIFAAILISLDEAVGKITAALRAAGVADNTVVVFLGDNGCGGCRNTLLRGGKGTNYEGGVRVPFLLSWPGRLQAGRRYAQPVIATDLFATFLAAAGGAPAGVVDGVDLLPYLNGSRPGAPHAYLFWGN